MLIAFLTSSNGNVGTNIFRQILGITIRTIFRAGGRRRPTADRGAGVFTDKLQVLKPVAGNSAQIPSFWPSGLLQESFNDYFYL